MATFLQISNHSFGFTPLLTWHPHYSVAFSPSLAFCSPVNVPLGSILSQFLIFLNGQFTSSSRLLSLSLSV
jgi:hypothetical protein